MPKVEQDNRTVYLGIDPGASGGLAAICMDLVDASAMPQTERDVWDWISGKNPQGAPGPIVFACIEKVNGYVGDKGNPGSAMFKFGANFGALKMALTAAGIPYEEIPPQTWQKALGIPRRDKSESKTAWKNRLKQKAQQLFPHVKITLATADALLISEFCRRKCQGLLQGVR